MMHEPALPPAAHPPAGRRLRSMSRWSRIAVVAAAVAGAALAAGGIFLASSDPAAYQSRLITTLQQHDGIVLVAAEAPRWQLWPLALHIGHLTLTDAATRAPLLEAAAADIGIAPAALLSGSPRRYVIALQGAEIHYRHESGTSNWSALLARLSATDSGPASRLTLQDSVLIVSDGQDRENARFDIASLRLGMPGAGGWPLTTRFDFTRQGRHGNLLAQGELHTRLLRRGARGVTLAGSVLDATVSSVLFPGEFAFTARGDLDVGAGRLTATMLDIDGNYKNIAMRSAMPFHLATPLQLDTGTLLLPAWQLTAGGTAPALTATATLRMDWQQGPLTLSVQDGHARAKTLDLQDIRVDASAHDGGLTVSRASARSGKGRMNLPLSVDVSGDAPVAELRPDLQDIDLAVVAPLLGADADANGLFSLHGRLQVSGYTPRDWLAAATGMLQVQVRDGHIGADAGRALQEKLQDYRSFLPPLAVPAPTGPGRLQLTIDNGFSDGIVHSRIDVTLDHARLQGNGAFHLEQHAMQYRGTLTLDKALFAAPATAVTLPFECAGNPREEQMGFIEALNADCGIPDDYKRKMLARALNRRFLDH